MAVATATAMTTAGGNDQIASATESERDLAKGGRIGGRRPRQHFASWSRCGGSRFRDAVVAMVATFAGGSKGRSLRVGCSSHQEGEVAFESGTGATDAAMAVSPLQTTVRTGGRHQLPLLTQLAPPFNTNAMYCS